MTSTDGTHTQHDDHGQHGHGPHRHHDASATDPVCGMKVDPHTAKHQAAHAGTTYYFCSAKCREKFEADPVRYVTPGKRPPAPAGTTVVPAHSVNLAGGGMADNACDCRAVGGDPGARQNGALAAALAVAVGLVLVARRRRPD